MSASVRLTAGVGLQGRSPDFGDYMRAAQTLGVSSVTRTVEADLVEANKEITRLKGRFV